MQGHVLFTPNALWSDFEPGRFQVSSHNSSSNVQADTRDVLASTSRSRNMIASNVNVIGLQGPDSTNDSVCLGSFANFSK